jgi:hypothetical protein
MDSKMNPDAEACLEAWVVYIRELTAEAVNTTPAARYPTIYRDE